MYPIRNGSDVAFNQGSDARLAGESRLSNPYSHEFLMQEWERGWNDVDRFWGFWARWPVLKLPEV